MNKFTEFIARLLMGLVIVSALFLTMGLCASGIIGVIKLVEFLVAYSDSNDSGELTLGTPVVFDDTESGYISVLLIADDGSCSVYSTQIA